MAAIVPILIASNAIAFGSRLTSGLPLKSGRYFEKYGYEFYISSQEDYVNLRYRFSDGEFIKGWLSGPSYWFRGEESRIDKACKKLLKKNGLIPK